ncbi:hypothetical protein GVN24_12015 [Rhizobium sp. CRIBSB]|nr:hypothetical protein [Rhizobium sp. CRIBSB]
MQLQSSALRRNTVWALFLILSLSAYENSILNIALIVSAAWALCFLLVGVLKPRLDGAIGFFVAAAAAYFVVHVVYLFAHYGTHFPKPDKEWAEPLKLVTFLLPFFIAARLAAVPSESLLRTVWLAAAVWGLATLPYTLYQGLLLDMRAEAGTGNAIPFALMGSLFSSCALLGLNEKDRRYRWLAAAGFAAGFLCVLFSQTKSMMPVPILGLALFWLIFLRGRMPLWQLAGIGLAVMLFAGIGFYLSDSWERFRDIWAILVQEDPSAQLGNSYTERLTMWSHGLAAVLDAPFSGHGFQNRRHFIGLLGYDYNHWHNGFLTAAFDNGIPGLLVMTVLLVAPMIIAVRAAKDDLYRPRLFIATILVFAYAWGGMVNQVFGHMIYDALFLWVGTIIAVSATPGANTDVEGSA